MKHETETKLPKTEQLIHEPSVEQKYNQGEQYSPENGLSDPDMGSVVSPNISNVCSTSTTKQLLFVVLDLLVAELLLRHVWM